ncbi:MAG: thioredoxin family protein [Planctomycetota bacterium]|nr:thioredoxin family protein [Planctomycetota bacterium]
MRSVPMQFVLILISVLALVGVLAQVFGAGPGAAAPLPAMFGEKLTFEQALERSRLESKPIFAVFSATWCGPCQSYKRGGLADPRVNEFVKKHMIPAYVDTDEQPKAARDCGVSGIPLTTALDGGKVVKRGLGALTGDELYLWLQQFRPPAAEPAAPPAKEPSAGE